MKTKILWVAFLILATALTVSCGKGSCKKQVIKELKNSGREYIPQDMNDAIAHYDFDAARMYANCNSIGDVFNGEGESLPPELTRAEVSYKISLGNYGAAQATAREDGHPELFNMMYADALNAMLTDGNYDQVMAAVSSWSFTYSSSDKESYYLPESQLVSTWKISMLGDGKGWELYNKEVEKYNGIVDKLLVHYQFDGNKEAVQKCLALYAPMTVADVDGNLSQVNKAYAESVKKLK